MISLPEPLLDVAAVAEIFGVRPQWVYEHLDELPHVRVGRYVRFETAAIREYVDRQRREPESNPFGQ